MVLRNREAKLINADDLTTITQAESTSINNQAPCWLIDKMAAGLMNSNAAAERIKNHYRTVYSPIIHNS
jgi:hypothetical protein